jgi:myo-inositol-1(or 4)-monophosphatase
MCHSLRSIGSAALNFAYVASGQLDLYWEIGCWSWDVCAGMSISLKDIRQGDDDDGLVGIVIATEAGGRCYGRGGKELDAEGLMGHHFLVIRGIEDTPGGETGRETQDRLAKEFFERVEEWDA